MTLRKSFKRLVRARMAKTGESYSTARRQFISQPDLQRAHPAHFPGNIPAATAFRIALTASGLLDPRTGKPFTEAMAMGLAGGIGIGTFSFVYEKENVATFYITGRHIPHDDLLYLTRAAERLGVEAIVLESSSEKKASQQLEQVLSEHGPCIAWVDAASLPHRGMPEEFIGGGYHVVVVYELLNDSVVIGDLTDEPISIPRDTFSLSRNRIKKQKNRLLAFPRTSKTNALQNASREALRSCVEGLEGRFAVKGYGTNFSLDGLKRWAEQLFNARGKESWKERFAPGPRLWQGLIGISDFIENYGTGGGLSRPLFATFLREAENLLGKSTSAIAARYTRLGQLWSELAHAALPEEVPVFRKARKLLTTKSELFHSDGDEEKIRGIWNELALLKAPTQPFPISASESEELLARLQRLVLKIHQEEIEAKEELRHLIEA